MPARRNLGFRAFNLDRRGTRDIHITVCRLGLRPRRTLPRSSCHRAPPTGLPVRLAGLGPSFGRLSPSRDHPQGGWERDRKGGGCRG